MTEVEPVLDFASSGRSGRRNALPDILGSPAGVNPGDLPLKLAELNLKGEAEGWRASEAQQSSAQHIFFPCLCTDGPGGAQSPSAEDPPAPPDSSEEKEGS